MEQGPFVQGRQHGSWVVQEPDGDVAEGLLVDGRRQGIWTWWFANGNVKETPFVNGERNGTAIECVRDPGDFIAWILRYVDGEEVDSSTIGPRDADAPTTGARCTALLSKPRPTT